MRVRTWQPTGQPWDGYMVMLEGAGFRGGDVPYTLELLGDAVCTHDDRCDLKALCARVLILEPGEYVYCTCLPRVPMAGLLPDRS